MGISTFQSDSQELAEREEQKEKKIFLCVYTRRAVKSALISVCLQRVCLSVDLFQFHVGVRLLLAVVWSQHKAGVKQMNQTAGISGKGCYLGALLEGGIASGRAWWSSAASWGCWLLWQLPELCWAPLAHSTGPSPLHGQSGLRFNGELRAEAPKIKG